MAKQWKCARCSTKNDEGTLTCASCRMIRGAVVVPRTFSSLPTLPAATEQGWADGVAPLTPSVSEWAAHANERHRLLTPIPIGFLILTLILVAAGVAEFFSTGPSLTDVITDNSTIEYTDLRVGDCFDFDETSDGSIVDLTARSCSDPHQYELFWSGPMSGSSYPTDDAFETFFADHCVGAFDAYVGAVYADSRFDIYWLAPHEEGWAAGERTIQCAAYDPSNPRLTGSLKGYGPSANQPIPL